MGRMHSDAQFAGSSSVPAHVEMMGFLGIGNNGGFFDMIVQHNGVSRHLLLCQNSKGLPL